ncbi:hypothetical protein B0H11DRAFT_2251704 [Mycena galericulata]|nr:hypothetical protein B0H11DRAFT_2251704 [Mycena galericulata]
MAPRGKRQKLGHALHDRHTSDDNDAENIPPDDSPAHIPPTVGKPKTLRAQLVEQDVYIAELETTNTALQAQILELRETHTAALKSISADNKKLISRNEMLSLSTSSLKNLKRKAEEELTKKHKQVKRLERERFTKDNMNTDKLSAFKNTLNEGSREITKLRHDLASANDQLCSRDAVISSLESDLKATQFTLTETRSKLYASQKQAERAKKSLQEMRKAYKLLRTWDPMEGGTYSAASRELARNLTYTGCSADKVEFAVRSCRAIDEGGKYGEIQLAREILDAPGFVESSDGTTHRGITVESRHVTLLVPSYEPGVDDSDRSTWQHRTRFVEVAPALDHTGQRQFDGTVEAASRIADTYARSPMAAKDKRTMDKNEYWRKKIGEHKDHAADGKKEFKISAQHKKNIVVRDIGRAAMEQVDIESGLILLTVLEISDEDLMEAGHLSASELAALTTEQRAALVEEVLEQRIGTQKFDSMTDAEQRNACTHIFGGCCCHKDLNVVRYGVFRMQRAYLKYDLTPPVLLANKANSAVIALTKDPDDAALQNAIDSSSRGAIKLLSLLGSLLRHKDGERGYQDKCAIFMRQRKLEQYDLEAPGKFPDVSNTRYGCHTYAAAEVICFPGLFQELITEIIDGKTKSGQPNHVELNILKGLNCPVTMSELVALAVYGLSVSWPYMVMIRGPKENPTNLLSLTDLHRRLPDFCDHIAAHPYTLLDPTTPLNQLTIDAQPFADKLLLHSIREMTQARDLPNLFLLISEMFAGCADGWRQFTPEFKIGGTFDQLTPEQRAILFIPATNDCNEGMLGSYRVHMRYHPNSTAHSFSSQTRAERNNTEAFIKKCCDDAVQKFVMREVRKDGASGARVKFRKAFAALQREKAEKALKRRKKTADRKKDAAIRLAETELELDKDKIRELSSPRLKEQLRVYRDVLKDPILLQKLWKDMGTAPVRRELVLEARERELSRRASKDPGSSLASSSCGSESDVIVEYGYSLEDEADWEDVVQ